MSGGEWGVVGGVGYVGWILNRKREGGLSESMLGKIEDYCTGRTDTLARTHLSPRTVGHYWTLPGRIKLLKRPPSITNLSVSLINRSEYWQHER